MQIIILKNEEGYLKLNIKGTDPHSLFNLLRDELLNDAKVDFAGYWRDESFYESLIFQLRMKTKTSDPVKAINEALERIGVYTKEFIDLCKAKIE
ncbi:MAG: RpoL/Rpb11 RNA polymerase subunit family protein [Candidatus Heimdallarchaeaceae archaeon]